MYLGCVFFIDIDKYDNDKKKISIGSNVLN